MKIAPVLRPDIQGERRISFRTFDSRCHMSFILDDDVVSEEFLSASLGWLKSFESKFSLAISESELSRLNRNVTGAWLRVSSQMEFMLDLVEDLFRISKGIIDPTILPLLNLWDWREVYDGVPTETKIAQNQNLVGWNELDRRPGYILLPVRGMALDFGGFLKELAVDNLVRIARAHGVENLLVNLGGDIYTLGGQVDMPFWLVNVESSLATQKSLTTLTASEVGISTSTLDRGGFEYAGIRYGRIIDPRIGRPVSNEIESVTVVASSCLMAGVCSKVVCVLGEEEGMKFLSKQENTEAFISSLSGCRKTAGFEVYETRLMSK